MYEVGYKTLISSTIGVSNREEEFLDMLDRNMVDGIIAGSHTLEGEEISRKENMLSSPLTEISEPEIPMIGSDHVTGGRLAGGGFDSE